MKRLLSMFRMEQKPSGVSENYVITQDCKGLKAYYTGYEYWTHKPVEAKKFKNEVQAKKYAKPWHTIEVYSS